MDDIEAYGQLRKRPLTQPKGQALDPPSRGGDGGRGSKRRGRDGGDASAAATNELAAGGRAGWKARAMAGASPGAKSVAKPGAIAPGERRQGPRDRRRAGSIAPAHTEEELEAARRIARPKRSHWLRNAVLLVAAYFAIAIVTTVQPLPLPFVAARLAVPFPGGAPMLFGLPDRPYTVVVIGLDRRPSETGASRADTVLLLRIDPGSHRAAFISIPRDAMMEIPNGDGSYYRDRINTAFVYNYSSEDEDAAPRAVMETVEHNLGIKVDHYVIFDQYNAKDLIDAMGGVTIDNPVEFGQDNYSDDDINVVPQFFPEGQLKLSGYEAVAYGRIREGSSDFDRIERQQRVGAALIDRASSPLSVLRLPSAWRAYGDAIDTDMSLRQSAGVLAMLKRVPDDKLQTKSLGDASVSCVSCPASIQLLDPDKTAAIIAEAFGDDASGALAAELLLAAGVTP